LKIVPIAGDGWRFILGFGLVGPVLIAIGTAWSIPLGFVCVLLAVFSLFFFRDFDRDTKPDEQLIYSPADGKVMEVAILNEGPHAGYRQIRIFLSVFDGHIQRVPAAGVIKKVEYKKGLFLDARDLKAHIDNEQNSIELQTSKGTLIVKQIAGLIARRIVCYVKEGARLSQGERYGLIRFGSQVDVIMPASVRVLIKEGQRVTGGETVLGEWPS
jgi:phosphatidylserine decarboxylase